MSTTDKLIRDIRAQRDIRFEQISSLMARLGFSERSRGSHHTFTKDRFVITIPRKDPVKKPYLRELAKLLDELGY